MKTKLLKMALCAVAMLPMGAWADEIDFGTQASVSQKTVWNFNGLTTGTEYKAVTEYQNAYFRLRGNNETEQDTYKITVNDAPAESKVTLVDGSTMSVSKVITLKKSNFGGGVNTAANTGGDMQSTFAFNAEVPGYVYVYMKASKAVDSNHLRIFHTQKVNASNKLDAVTYTKPTGEMQTLKFRTSEKGTFFIGHNGESLTCDIYAVEFIPEASTVGSKTLWTFGQYPSTTVLMNDAIRERKEFDGLYIHTTSNVNHYARSSAKFAVNIAAEDFGGEALSGNMMPIQFAGKADAPNSEFKAGDYHRNYDGMAFNASCAGTAYFAFRTPAGTGDGGATDYTSRSFTIYFNGTAQTGTATQSYTNRGTYVVKYTSSEAGTFATMHTNGAVEIVAVLFVPTDADATQTQKVDISDADVATFSAARSYTVPSGLTAYKVSAVDEENKKVTLTDIGSIIPAYTGVILAGDEGAYTLTSTNESATVTGNSLVANVGEYVLPANSGDNYYYTLAAGPTFKHSAGSGTLACRKAYLSTTVNVTAGARGFDLVFDDGDVTGISEVNAVASDNKFYNLQGVEVKAPAKGLYIVNGKKVVIK